MKIGQIIRGEYKYEENESDTNVWIAEYSFDRANWIPAKNNMIPLHAFGRFRLDNKPKTGEQNDSETSEFSHTFKDSQEVSANILFLLTDEN